MTRRNIIIAVSVAALFALVLAAFSKWVLPFLAPVAEDFLLFLGVAVLAIMTIAQGLPALVSLVESLLPQPAPAFFRPVTGRPSSTDPLRYESRATQVFGQEHVYAGLDGFLRDERRFLWWLLSGRAGSGKSRLAHEWMLRAADDRAARCDVLDLLPASLKTDDLSAWMPPRDTVIVVDDAGEHADTVAELLECLTERPAGEGPRVRLLLVERSLPDAVRRMVERVTSVQNARYRPEDLTPVPLDAGQVDGLARALGDPRGDWTAEQLAEIERVSEGNPLIALAAAQLLTEQGGLSWSNRGALLDEWARRFESKLIQGGLDSECLPLVALATLVGGLRWDAGIPPPRACANPRLLAGLLGAPAQDALPPVRPDLLGEAFALHVCAGLTAPAVHEMATRAWQANAGAYAISLYRLHHDFPSHPLMALLDAPPDGAEPLGWWGEVRVWLTGEPGVELDVVSRYWAQLRDSLRPRIERRPAALALAQGAVNAANAYGGAGRWDELSAARTELRGVAERFPEDPAIQLALAKGETNVALARGRACREAGDPAGASRYADEARRWLGPDEAYNLACAEAVGGNADAALAQLARAKEFERLDPAWAWQDPDLEPLRSDPRFLEIVGPPGP